MVAKKHNSTPNLSLKMKPNGFSLIEVVVTIALIATTLVIYHATSQTVIINRWDRYREVALRIADQKMQNLRVTAHGSLPSTGSFSDPLLSSLPNGSGTLTVTDLNSKTKDIIVTVSWTNPQASGTQQVQLETYMTQGGIGQ